jgi:acyl-CoA synthetase (AMP-forming)/AMP-acid ligase II
MNATLSLHTLALRQPNKPAVISERQSLTFQQLDQLIWRGAEFFRAAGLSAGQRVALRVIDPVLHTLSSLALARLGVPYISSTPGESASMIDASVRRIGAQAVVSQAPIPEIDRTPQIIVSASAFSGGEKIARGVMCENPGQIFAFVSSSGTTGKAKLFAISHARWMSVMTQFQLAIPSAASDVLLSFPPPYFIAGTAQNLHALSGGATIVLPTSTVWASIFELMTRAGTNRVFAVPSILKNLLKAPGSAEILRQLSMLYVSGSVVSRSLREQTLKHTPGLLIVYGCNEMGMLSVTRGRHSLGLADTVGYPVPYGEFEIVDDAGRPLAPDQVGQIRVRQETMITSYFDDPRADERCFIGGWFYPGDLACWSRDGQVIFKGRADDMMIFDGINIYPAEIENCLQEHDRVLEAIAFPLPSQQHGEVPMAAVRLAAEASEDELIGFCRERLGVRHPRKVMIMDDFPRNAMGKPLKREVAAMMAAARGSEAAKRRAP